MCFLGGLVLRECPFLESQGPPLVFPGTSRARCGLIPGGLNLFLEF